MTSRRFLTLVLALAGLAIGSPALAVVSDATNLFAITKTGFVLNRTTNTYDTTVTLKNTSPLTVNAPVQLAVSGLPNGVTLANAAGTTSQGKPYVNVSVPGNTIIAGQIVTPIVLKFANPSRVSLTPAIAVSADIPEAAVGLPPDPGEAGKATVAGIDSNGNGVRDDVERLIALTYPDTPKLRSALMQSSKADQSILMVDGATAVTDPAVVSARRLTAMARRCLRYVVSGPRWIGVDDWMESIFFNTSNRIDASQRFDDLFAGQVIGDPAGLPPSESKQNCVGFDPDLP